MGDILSVIVAVTAVASRELTSSSGVSIDLPTTLGSIALYLVFIHLLSSLQSRTEHGGALGLGGLLHLLAFPCLVFLSEWVPLARQLSNNIPFVRTLFYLAPFLIAQIIKADAGFRARRSQGHFETKRWDYHLLRFRMILLPLVPLLLLKGLRSLIELFPELRESIDAWLPAQLGLMGATMLLIFAMTPWLLRVVTGSKALPQGSLRERLEAYNERVGFRPTGIFLWNTQGSMPNAMYIGILPWHRYVIMTDALLSQLDDAEVEAVYAHEIGHGARWHIPLYLLFLFASISLMMTHASEATWSPFPSGTVGTLLALPLIPLGIVLFGWISRRFETEADFFAAETIANPRDFERALQGVGLAAGALSHRGGYRHFDIGTRLGLLNRFRSEPEFRERWKKTFTRVHRGILVLAALAAAYLLISVPALDEERQLNEASFLAARGREEEQPALLRQAAKALDPFLSHPRLKAKARRELHYTLSSLGDVAMAGGNWEEARQALKGIDQLGCEDDIERINRDLLDALLRATGQSGREGPAAEISSSEVRKLIGELNDLVERYPGLDAESVEQAYAELYLALRATGDRKAVEAGTPSRWPLHCAKALWDEEHGKAKAELEGPDKDPAHALLLYHRARESRP